MFKPSFVSSSWAEDTDAEKEQSNADHLLKRSVIIVSGDADQSENRANRGQDRVRKPCFQLAHRNRHEPDSYDIQHPALLVARLKLQRRPRLESIYCVEKRGYVEV